jgi:hypothetical protein
MKNIDMLIKKLLNEINENHLESNKKLILEAPCGKPPNGQTALATMNQIWKFQEYIWGTIEKDIPKIKGTCDKEGKNCSYNSMLCKVKPCNKKAAVDGIYGDGTKNAWSKYGTQYKQKNTCWWVHDGETSAKILGQEIPVTMRQTKNFQRWIWTQIEKFPDNDNVKRNSSLCGKPPCTYTQAVDGILGNPGSKTRNLWEKYSASYMKANPQWYAEQIWDKETSDTKEKQQWIRKNFIFAEDNPSGYDNYSPVTNVFDWLKKNAQVLFRSTKESAEAVKLPNFGWDQNPTLFPTPKKYSETDFKNFYPEDEKKKVEKIKSEYEATQYTSPNMVSDRLGKGWGGTKGELESGLEQQYKGAIPGYQTDYEIYQKRLKETKNPYVLAAEKWNSDFDAVKGRINSKCLRPMKFWFQGLNDEKGEDRWLSYYDICKYAGGIWAYVQGSQVVCGCRYMSDKNGLTNLGGGNTRGDATIMIKGTDGNFIGMDFDWNSLDFQMKFQTKGGEQDKIYGDGEWDVHEILTVVEVITVVAGMIATGGLSTFLIGASALVGVSDSLVYYYEGDTYMGTMMLAINLAGGLDEIVTLVKWGKNLAKTWTKESLESIAKKVVSKQALEASEKQILSEVQQFVYKNQNEIAAKMQYDLANTFVTDGIITTAKNKNWGWDVFFNSVIKLAKMIGKSTLGGLVIKIGGVAVTADQLYLLMNGNDQQRKNSGIGILMDKLYSGLGLTNEQKQEKLKNENALNAYENLQETIKQDAGAFMSDEVTQQVLGFDPEKGYTKAELDTWAMQINEMRSVKPNVNKVESENKNIKFIDAPSIDDVRYNNMIIKLGMSGDSVSKIVTLLKTTKGVTDITNPLLYDDLVSYYIYNFQVEYDLTPTGNVDSETYYWLTGYAKSYLCDQIEKLKSEGWVQLNDLARNAKIAANQKDKIIELKCKGAKDIIYLYNKNYNEGSNRSDVEFFGKPEDVNSGIPRKYTMLDNPQNESAELQEQLSRIHNMMNLL